MNRTQLRRTLRPWRSSIRVKAYRAFTRARMPKDYYEKARAERERKKAEFRRLLGVER